MLIDNNPQVCGTCAHENQAKMNLRQRKINSTPVDSNAVDDFICPVPTKKSKKNENAQKVDVSMSKKVAANKSSVRCTRQRAEHELFAQNQRLGLRSNRGMENLDNSCWIAVIFQVSHLTCSASII